MYQFSDSETTDSDDGIRFKTATTRDKHKSANSARDKRPMRRRSKSPLRSRDRSDRARRRSKSRSKSPRRSSNTHKQRSLRRSRSRSVERPRRPSKSPVRFKVSPRRSYETAKKRSRSRSKERRKIRSSGSRTNLVQANISLDSLSDDDDLSGPLPLKARRQVEVTTSSVSQKVEKSRSEVSGPALPPRLQKASNSESDVETTSGISEPALPKESVETNSVNDSVEVISGPALPSHLQKFRDSDSENEASCGPTLAEHLEKSGSQRIEEISDDDIQTTNEVSEPTLQTCRESVEENVKEEASGGPALPSTLQNSSDSNSEVDTVCGPALPPHLLKPNNIPPEKSTVVTTKKERSIGPFIPEHLRKQLAEQSTETPPVIMDVSEDDKEEDEEDEDCYGPLPPELAQQSKAHVALEERALQIKLDQFTPQTSDEPLREEWMIELPTVQAANLGLGPRQFRAKPGPDMSDRSSWTDLPGAKKKPEKVEKVDLQKEAEIMAQQQRDEEQEAMVKKAKKKNKRDKSLMQQHLDKLNAKKKQQEEQGTGVRRPFNRDTDLKVNQFDDAQKKAIMKKANLLDDRFSHGQTKYL